MKLHNLHKHHKHHLRLSNHKLHKHHLRLSNHNFHIRAFSLLEVMIASGIFFAAVFVILQITSQQLRTARILQTLDVDTGSLPSLIVMTNMLEEGALPFEITTAFEEMNPGFSCEGWVFEYATNGLFGVDYTIRWQQEGKAREAKNRILLWRPNSATMSRRLSR